MKVRLLCLGADGQPNGVTHDITSPVTKMGRNPNNDIVVQDNHVSGTHGVITLMTETDRVLYTDSNSRNGSFVNQTRVHSATELTDGCTLTLGPINFRVEIEGGMPPISSEFTAVGADPDGTLSLDPEDAGTSFVGVPPWKPGQKQ